MKSALHLLAGIAGFATLCGPSACVLGVASDRLGVSRRVPSAAEEARVPESGAHGASQDTDSDSDLPARLSGTGLYSDVTARTLAPGVLPFTPQYPLWTDGATKRRWIRLPPGTSIDASDPDAWVFPAGTRLWKEFAFGNAVETRMLDLQSDGTWRFASYVWDAEQSDATLAPEAGVRGAATTLAGTPYDVPSRTDCRACHAAGRRTVLGFSALQLSSDRDPLAPHAETPGEGSIDLAALVARGLVRGLPQRLVDAPPRIEARSPRERAVLGYLHSNCGMCHAPEGELETLGFDLAHSLGDPAGDEGALATTIGKPSRFRFADLEGPKRVVPGDPGASVLARRIGSRQPIARMPPLGTRDPDEQALELIRQWIRTDAAAASHAVASSTKNSNEPNDR